MIRKIHDDDDDDDDDHPRRPNQLHREPSDSKQTQNPEPHHTTQQAGRGGPGLCPRVSPVGHSPPPRGAGLELVCGMVGRFGLGLLPMVVHVIISPPLRGLLKQGNYQVRPSHAEAHIEKAWAAVRREGLTGRRLRWLCVNNSRSSEQRRICCRSALQS